ncbi:hypothetical protein CSKR_102076 [Clonorchis sinensis]|uniref:Uncharacterized protein n=2 Tax=Clonorchis sinensis TaxID=79923 RepID=G7YFB8_CLOSI|nr:hypothetical protein CSKR_102076 [Clonorchis sinensis]GAA51651.1 hypothetical protein CLF_106550 [Clonorchis sinensis]
MALKYVLVAIRFGCLVRDVGRQLTDDHLSAQMKMNIMLQYQQNVLINPLKGFNKAENPTKLAYEERDSIRRFYAKSISLKDVLRIGLEKQHMFGQEVHVELVVCRRRVFSNILGGVIRLYV